MLKSVYIAVTNVCTCYCCEYDTSKQNILFFTLKTKKSNFCPLHGSTKISKFKLSIPAVLQTSSFRSFTSGFVFIFQGH